MMKSLLQGFALFSVLGLASAMEGSIWMSDHYTYSPRLKSDAALEERINEAINSDATLFVRWIASSS